MKEYVEDQKILNCQRIGTVNKKFKKSLVVSLDIRKW